MAAPDPIGGLAEIADRYDVLLCDVWGVVHNGAEAYPAACTALARFKAEQRPVVLISNAPRPASAVVEQFVDLGVPTAAWSTLVTSGDATRAALQARAGATVWAIGPARDAALYDGLSLNFTEAAEEAELVVCTGLFNDEVETADDYRERLKSAAARRLPFICANPDRVVQRGDRLIPCAGALADLYAALGGEAVMLGKPYGPIYDLALQAAARERGAPPERSRVLCIGDGLQTDVAGANAQGLDCLFIGGGIHAAETLEPGGGLDLRRTAALLDRAGARARYAMAELAA